MKYDRTDTPGRGCRLRSAAVLVTILACAACTQRVVRSDGLASLGPVLSVERFLQASNARDFQAMARLFGTPGGPVSDTGGAVGCAFKRLGAWFGMGEGCVRREDVELRMAAIADILRHDDFQIASERQEPGRTDPTSRIGVDLRRAGTVYRDVPFLVVQTDDGGWIVQEIDLQAITGN